MVYVVAWNVDRCFYGSLVNDVFLLDKISTIIADDGDDADDEDDENSSINDTLEEEEEKEEGEGEGEEEEEEEEALLREEEEIVDRERARDITMHYILTTEDVGKL
ncbi:hypothetical protein V1478_002911 [Vespula squamosa]|uniref:Uncharacterized protein n=1 Tax=Vespula squamosa TaxID=30214 RepID=A0ABD2BR71_VESSQ